MLANGTYKLEHVASLLLLDDPAASKMAGVQIMQGPAANGTNQRWTFTYSGGAYTIQNLSSGDFLTDPNTTGEAHAPLQQQLLSAENPAQLWSISGTAG